MKCLNCSSIEVTTEDKAYIYLVTELKNGNFKPIYENEIPQGFVSNVSLCKSCGFIHLFAVTD